MRAKSEASSFRSRLDGLFKVEEVPFVLPRESQQGTWNEKMHSVIPEALLSFSISFFLTFFFFLTQILELLKHVSYSAQPLREAFLPLM